MTYSDDLYAARRPAYDALRAKAKALRSQARRAEEKGDYETASRLRGEVDGINLDLAHRRS